MNKINKKYMIFNNNYYNHLINYYKININQIIILNKYI